jgi:hypothetical protein
MWLSIAAHGRYDLSLHLGVRWLHSLGAWWVRSRRRAGLRIEGSSRPTPFDIALSMPAEPRLDNACMPVSATWTSGLALRAMRIADSVLRWNISDIEAIAHEYGVRSRYLCFAPGAGNWLNSADNKRWPASHWQKLIMRMHRRHGFEVVVLGTAGDFPADQLPAGAVSLAGRTSLPQTASLIRHSAGFVGHDSGLFHMALGLNTPAAAFFGPTREDLTGPFRRPRALVLRTDIPCARCCRAACRVARCRSAGV